MFTLTDERFADAERRAMLERSRRARAETTRPFRDDELAMRKVLPFEQRVIGKPQ